MGNAADTQQDRFDGSRRRWGPLLRGGLLSLAILLLAGCTAPDEGTLPSSSANPDSTTFLTTTTVPEGATTSTTVPVVTVTTTENFVRFIHPNEWTDIRVSCMAEEGWTVTTSPDGGVFFPKVTEEQAAEMEKASDLCGERYPVDPKYLQPFTREQLTILYDWHVNTTIPCMEAEGFTGFDPPSLESFIETYEQEAWSPYSDVFGQIEQRGGTACPELPPIEVLFGE